MDFNTIYLVIIMLGIGILLIYINSKMCSKAIPNEPYNPPVARALSQNYISNSADLVLTMDAQNNYETISIYNMAFPVNTILLWNNTDPNANPPAGWGLCDGNGGRPNMKYKFPIGLDTLDSSFNTLGKEGGAETHTLTATEMPKHAHTYNRIQEKNDSKADPGVTDVSAANQWLTGINTTENGSGEAHENMPPYIVIKFIIKL